MGMLEHVSNLSLDFNKLGLQANKFILSFFNRSFCTFPLFVTRIRKLTTPQFVILHIPSLKLSEFSVSLTFQSYRGNNVAGRMLRGNVIKLGDIPKYDPFLYLHALKNYNLV
ncbi:hypothetical protein L9F63_018591, partial [Diploptera punctata]